MKRFFDILTEVLMHLSFIEALIVLVLFVTDRFNHAMGFMTADISKWLICALCATVSLLFICLMVRFYRKDH